MVESFDSPVADSLTPTLLHFLWQGSLIGLGYWVLLAATGVQSAGIRYATSLLALSVIALCPLVTFAMVYDSAVTVDEKSTPVVATPSSYLPETSADPVITHRSVAAAADGKIANEGVSEFGTAGGERRGFAGVQSALEASQPYVQGF